MRISDWSSDVCSSDLEYRGIDLRRVAAEFDPHLRQARSDGVHRMVIFERLDLIGAAWQRELDPVDRQDRPVGEHQRIIRDELVDFLLTGNFQRAFGTLPHQLDEQGIAQLAFRSEEHTSELQSLMRISYAVFCLKKKNKQQQ